MCAVRAHVTGTKRWLDQALAPGIFDLLHIAAVADFEVDSHCQLVAAAIRLHGPDFLAGASPNTRRVREAAKALRDEISRFDAASLSAWRKILGVAVFIPPRDLARKVVAVIKKNRSAIRQAHAQIYLISLSKDRRDLPTANGRG